ncbi:MAG: anhydro-N-acetylmuramic acid kinase [Rhizobiaceae bacterium]|nr:anhydro-N-acetylmuramic acid kinase [Rhizobiaceae bacterium]
MADLKTAIGLMSGTSMDGIDIALVRTDGEGVVERGPAMGVAYEPAFRKTLAQALETATSIRHREERPGNLGAVERALTLRHASAVGAFLRKVDIAKKDIDFIGFHGQTVLHRPREGLTVQIGDGGLLARETGIAVVHDMRANDMAHGGQGAPLVPAYHAALAAGLDGFAGQPVMFVNIGGISNLTFIGADGTIVAYDSGPGNTLIDQWVEAQAGIPYDAGGAIASEGGIVASMAARYLGHPFFTSEKRMSLDRNDFRPPSSGEAGLHDGARTLAHVTAAAIERSMRHLPEKPKLIVVCGGGRLNRVIMADLAEFVPEARVAPAETFGFNGDSMEAEAWAYLAVRSSRGLPLTFPGTTGVREPVSGGVLARRPVLTTERLVLSLWEPGDARSLAALHAVPEAARFVSTGQPWTEDYAQSRIDGWLEDLARFGVTKYKMTARDDGRFIGRAGFGYVPERDVFELGYSIMPDEWGKGFATEIARGLAGWFFSNRREPRFVAFAYAENHASIRVMRKLGMTEIAPAEVPRGWARFFELRRAR